MQKINYLPVRKTALIAAILLFSLNIVKAQSVYLPNSYQFYQKFNATIYSTNSSFHTALKPFLIDSTIQKTYDALMLRGVDSSHHSWAGRKLFNEHLVDIKTKEYTFYADYLTDSQLGRDITDKINTYTNTRGYQFGGTVGTKFSFYTSGFENAGKFPTYLNDYINKFGIVPGQAYDRSFGGTKKDWSYVTAILSYTPIKQLNITLGEDKTFIGDGYRSLLLSDYAANYPLLRVTLNLGKVQYMMQWAYLEELAAKYEGAPKFDSFGSNRRKVAAFHYLDWNISNRVSLGFFNALIAPEANDAGNVHGFDANYINPILFASSLGPSSASLKDNVFVGFTGKYKIFDKTAIYAQLLLDRFTSSDFFSGGNADNTNGYQIGIRGADLFKVNSLNYLFEYNTVKPYTYAGSNNITAYTEYQEPLGDPLGANFKEFIGILNYTYGKFDFTGQLNYAKYGLDPAANQNLGKDINKPFIPTATTSTVIGQGIDTKLYFAEGTVSYLINAKFNLRLEAGGFIRDEKNALGDKKTTMITFGLRSSFRNLYHDF